MGADAVPARRARPAPLAPRAHIQRDTRAQRAHLGTAALHLQALRAGAEPRELARRLALLREALAGSPAHRLRLAARGLSPRDLQRLEDLPHFPALTRAELDEAWDTLPVIDDDALTVVRSSGTTGEPVRVVRGAYDNLHMWTALQYWLERLGLELPPRPRVVLLDALPGGLEYSVRLPLLGDGALHRISTARPDALARLLRVRPAVIFSDPAGLHWLGAQHERPTPRLVLSSAQPLAPALRAGLPWPVVDYYATTETGPIAWACLRAPDRFHALAPDVHLESVGGELRVTRLRPSPLPLLRYVPGDRGEVVEGRCPCGFAGQSVVGLHGRQACHFLRPDGSRVDAWSLAWLFKHHPLRAFRLTQRGLQDFVLELDAPTPAPALLDTLRAALQQLGFPAPRLEVRPAPAPSAAKHEPFHTALSSSSTPEASSSRSS